MPSLDPAQATILAASMTACVAAFVAFATLFNGRRAELRASQRKLLENHLPKLGTALHEIVATSEILLKTRSPEARQAWDAKGLKAKKTLIRCHMEMRYTLWGITSALKTLSRLPSWAQHAKRHPQRAREIVDSGNALARTIDHAVLASLRSGRPPTWWRRFLVWRRKEKLLKAYAVFKATPRPPAPLNPPHS
jgi:hypothetical protein